MMDQQERHGGEPVDHSRQLARLRRVEGQVRGLHQMIETKRDCLEVVHQIDAVVAALRRVQADMLGDHLDAVTRAILSGRLSDERRRELTEEVARLIARRE
jgi:DNA-binding FrmR family transcriptional regulator